MKGMTRHPPNRAFTITEILVVSVIIAVLIGLLLPAIGKARDQALYARSQANMTQLGKAAASYAAEFGDRQLTLVNDNLSRYGSNGPGAFQNYEAQVGYPAPSVMLGYGINAQGVGSEWSFQIAGPIWDNWKMCVPIDFVSRFGAFRLINARSFSTYLNGRFYDPVFYAPKDLTLYNSVEPIFDLPDEFCLTPEIIAEGIKFSSYCFSPAAMFNPAVLSKNAQSKFFTDAFALPSGFRSPGMSQAKYATLKTHIIEHNWCQNRKKACNDGFSPPMESHPGCEPYYFNASWDSSPVTLFFDGHVGAVGCRDAMADSKRVTVQAGNANHGLWSTDTPLGGSYEDNGPGGYFSDYANDWTSTSFHILTIDGIKGRDVLPKS
jgi:prepilin-type N-terminal cleavage/methylation domain-containing protein